jgi:ABC-type transport system substrate-binding protein
MLHKMKFYFILALILASLLAIIACEATPSTTPAQTQAQTPAPTPTQTSAPATTKTAATATPYSTPTPTPTGPQQYGGVLKVICNPGITNLGYPGKAYTPGAVLYMRPAIEYLINRNPQNADEAVGELAESFEWSADYLSLTLHLRKGIKFHDGTNFNAAAVKFNLEMHKTGARAELQPVTSVDIIDDSTVRLKLSRYDSGFLLGLMSLSGYMVSPHAIETMGEAATFYPVGTGPFKFVEYKRDVSLKYARNPDYWQKGKPYLDGIEFLFIADPVTQVAVLKAGDAHVIREVSVNDVAGLDKVGFNISVSPGSVDGLAMDSNHSDSHFHDIRVRQAIAYAIDNAAIAKALGHGFYEAVNQWFPKKNIAYNPDIVGYPYNLAKAKQLLSEAGYPNGFDTELWYESTSTSQKDTYGAVQGYLAEAGINAKLKPTDRGAFNAHVMEGWRDHMVHIYVAVALGIDPVSSLRTKMVSIAQRYSVESIWIPEDYDALYFEAAEAKDMKTYKELFMKLGKLMIDEYLIAVPIVAPSSFKATAPGVHFDLHEYGMAEYRPEEAWIEQ